MRASTRCGSPSPAAIPCRPACSVVSGPTAESALSHPDSAGYGGILRTGDVGTIDDDGLLRIVGRLKDISISGGLNIHTAELERVILGLDAGVNQYVVDVSTEVLVDHDGHTPREATIRAWTDAGRGYAITGSVDVSSVASHDGGHFATESYGLYRLGGRLGGGHLAVRERGAPSPQHRSRLEVHEAGTS